MDDSAKKQQHEQDRKKHKHDQQEHAREVARREPSRLPLVLLVLGLIVVIAFVGFIATR